MNIISSLRRLSQGDHYKFEVSWEYTVSFRPANNSMRFCQEGEGGGGGGRPRGGGRRGGRRGRRRGEEEQPFFKWLYKTVCRLFVALV